jgi:hypothetical protein
MGTAIAAWFVVGVARALASATGLTGPAGPVPGAVVWSLVGAGLVLDLVTLATGRPKPLANGRQVPREWGRLLPPSTVAVLYGARLGVGPLTMLSTWTWWSVTVASALIGLGTAVGVAATFAVVRLVVSLAFSELAGDREHATSFGRLQAARRPGRLALNLLGLVAIVAVVGTACSSGPGLELAGERPHLDAESNSRPPLRSEPLDDDALEVVTRSLAPDGSAQPVDPDAVPYDATPPVTAPAALEDFVRPSPAAHTATPIAGLATAPEESEALSATPDALAGALVPVIEGFAPIDGSATDRYLDLDAAAAIQPDPTEEIGLLETRGFRGGWTRAFRSTGNDVAVTSVYQFADAAQAEYYLEDGLIMIGGYGGTFFDIEGLPGVRGFTQSFVEEGEELVSLGAAFQAGPRWYLVYFVGSPDTVTPDVLVPTVTRQRASALELVES